MSTPSPINPYTQPKASSMATRSLVSPAPLSSSEAVSTSTDKPTLARKPTDNYSRAATEAAATAKATSTTAPVGSVVPTAASTNDRPAMSTRQQSWKMSDFKGQQQEQMVAGKAGGLGYSSTSGEK